MALVDGAAQAGLCLDSNCSFGKIVVVIERAALMLCLDSNCSFGKITDKAETLAQALCLDSNCSFGKMRRVRVRGARGFALIPIVLSAKYPARPPPPFLRFALIPIVLSAK